MASRAWSTCFLAMTGAGCGHGGGWTASAAIFIYLTFSASGCQFNQVKCWDDSCADSYSLCAENPTCPSDNFQCRNKRCVAQDQRCDGLNDCLDYSDERGCPTKASWTPWTRKVRWWQWLLCAVGVLKLMAISAYCLDKRKTRRNDHISTRIDLTRTCSNRRPVGARLSTANGAPRSRSNSRHDLAVPGSNWSRRASHESLPSHRSRENSIRRSRESLRSSGRSRENLPGHNRLGDNIPIQCNCRLSRESLGSYRTSSRERIPTFSRSRSRDDLLLGSRSPERSRSHSRSRSASTRSAYGRPRSHHASRETLSVPTHTDIARAWTMVSNGGEDDSGQEETSGLLAPPPCYEQAITSSVYSIPSQTDITVETETEGLPKYDAVSHITCTSLPPSPHREPPCPNVKTPPTVWLTQASVEEQRPEWQV